MAFETLGIRIKVTGFAQANSQLIALNKSMASVASGTEALSRSTSSYTQKLSALGSKLTSVGQSLTKNLTLPILAAGTAIVAAGISFEDAFAGVTKTVQESAIGFDDIAMKLFGTTKGLTDAQKAAVFADESFGKLTEGGEDFRKKLLELSTEIPISANELARIGQIAGQLGVPFGESGEILLEFTKTAALLGVATDFTAEQAATSLARLGNILGVSSEDLSKFAEQAGNAIVGLGNNVAATEPEITALALRIAGAGRAVGMTGADILGISASLAEAGVRAELGGSAVSRILLEMSFAVNEFDSAKKTFKTAVNTMDEDLGYLRKAMQRGVGIDQLNADFTNLNLEGLEQDIRGIADGTQTLDDVLHNVRTRTIADLEGDLGKAGKQFKVLARVIGVSEQALKDLIRTDPTQAFQRLLSGLAQAQAEGTLTSETLDDLNLNTIRLKDVVNRLGPNQERMTRNIGLANEQWVEQVALQEEAIKRFRTTKSQITLLVNELKVFAIELFNLYSKQIVGLITGLRGMITTFRNLSDPIKKTVVGIGLLVGAVGPLLTIFGKFLSFSGFGLGGFSKLFSPFTLISKLFSKLTFNPANIIGNIFGKINVTGLLKSGFSDIFKGFDTLFGGILRLGNKFTNTLFSNIIGGFKTLGNTITFVLTPFVGGFASLASTIAGVISGPLSLLKKAFSGIFGLLGKLSSSIFSVFSGLSKLAFGVAGSIGGIFGKLISGLLGNIFKIPLLIAGAFALAFGPSLISQVIKNWDKVLENLKISFGQFIDDLKNFGLSKAILLFLGGGSTGSGRAGGLLGLAKAIGFSEMEAKKLSFALGSAASWIMRILSATKDFIVLLVTGKKEAAGIGDGFEQTASTLVSISQAVAQFFEGFFVGWTSSFTEIYNAFQTFWTSAKQASGALKGLFTAIFGEAATSAQDVLFPMEQATENAAGRVGISVGQLVADVISTTLQIFSILAQISTVVIDTFAGIVKSYKEEGLAGIFDNLVDTLSELWKGITPIASEVIDKLTPAFTEIADWIKTTGLGLLTTAAKGIADVIKDLFTGTREATTIQTPVRMFAAFRNTGEKVGIFTAEAYQEALEKGFLETSSGNIALDKVIFSPQDFMQQETITEGFKGLIPSVTEFFSNQENIDKITESINNAFVKVGDFIKKDIWEPIIKPALEKLWEDLKNWFNNTAKPEAEKAVKEALEDIGVAIVDGLTGNLQAQTGLSSAQIQNMVENMSPELLKEFYLKRMEDIGVEGAAAIVRGFDDGTEEELFKIRDSALKISDTLTSNIKTALQIFSPSGVFRQIGQDTILGLTQGLDNNLFLLHGAANRITGVFTGIKNNITNTVTQTQLQVNKMLSLVDTVRNLAETALGNIFSVLSNNNLQGVGDTISNTNNANTNNNIFSPTVSGENIQQATSVVNDLYTTWQMA